MKKILSYFKKDWAQLILIIAILFLLFLSFYPIYMLIIKSFKTISDDQSNPFGFPKNFTFENYQYAWIIVKPYLFNSLLMTAAQTLGVVLFSSFAGFAFVKFEFPFKNAIFFAILSIMMIPGIVTLTSQYTLVNKLNLVNNRLGVILPGIAGTLPFSIFLLRTSFSGVSSELIDASTIDGANDFQVFRHIMIPISKPILWTVIITTFVGEIGRAHV